ncbi:DUF3344 domain-containing protein [Methanobrevibacter sp.]|uniref:DUF3344 domain-containing protein n=1 Tax=Methanobrevibacter sp. TaxID=66852 RepID=UPI00388FFAE2
MGNKKILFIAILLFMVVLSIGAISAEDVDDAIVSSGDNDVLGNSESVSGGVDVVTENPWNTSGELSYDIPSDAKSIKSADVYVNVYAGSANNNYGANANITITTDNNSVEYPESLWIEEGSADGTVYPVNDHTTKCYSDYMIHYDVTDMLDGLNGTNLKINVDTFEMEGKQFDGRIKLIALILAYDDGDDDSISYWINDDQLWTKGNVTVTFDTEDTSYFTNAGLRNVVLSSGDGTYMMNGEFLGDAYYHDSGNYYQYNEWDVTGEVKANQKTNLDVIYAGTSSWGSIKNVLSVLTIENLVTDISLTPEYYSVPSAYAGTNNTLTIKVKTSKEGNYTINLLADDVNVDGADVALVQGDNTVFLTDPTIRPIDESTVNGAENNIVKYTAELYYGEDVINSEEISIPVLYNGNLGYDMEYNVTGFEGFGPITVTGDVVLDIKDASSYLGAAVMNRTDSWTVALNDGSEITNAFVYVPYNWFNGKTFTEDTSMFNVMFNGVNVTPIAWYRDQGNLGNYGKYGYGVLIYDVSDLITVGDNSFVLNKVNPTPAVYPSALVYMYDTDGSATSKTAYILNGADLLSNGNNVAKRTAKSDTEIAVDVNKVVNATLYVLAGGAQVGESNIVFNDNVYTDVWSGSSSTTDLFTTDVTSLIKDSNSISFVATGSTILALPQIIVTAKDLMDTTLVAEYKNGRVVATLTDEDGNPVVGVKVNMVLGDIDKTVRTDAKGRISASTKNFDVGDYTAVITFAGDKVYAPSQTTLDVAVRDVSVLSANDVVAVYNVTSRLYATLADADGNPIVGVKVNMVLGDINKTVKTDAKGRISASTKNLDVGDYTAVITFAGDEVYAPSQTTANVFVRAVSVLSANDVVAVYNVPSRLYATLTDADGNPIVGVKVNLVLGNINKNVKTDSKGRISASTKNLDVGEYTAVITFAGDEVYAPSQTTAKVLVKIGTELTAKDVVAEYNVSSRLYATLKDTDGNIITGAKVNVVLGDINKTVKTDSKGRVSVSTVSLTPGNYTAKISYAGSDIYSESSTTAKVVVNKIPTTLAAKDVVADQGSSTRFYVTLKDVDGNPLTGVKVHLVLGSIDKTVKTDANGRISASLKNLAAGNYTAMISCDGTEIYAASSATASVVIR